ncbi:MAG TPA: nuclear transport factor 2 family protein [Acetobacteraceae bacterium]|jgi:ketosteroid isomerase-like protein|nr:nuclear transport factor 2 family protein [Acetobacteraceae bacterium]HEX4365538.1 nuclear transport factor 2 family protein [Rhodopila sp.]
MAGNAQKIIDLDHQRMTAMARKDVATLTKILSNDLIYTHSSARMDTKQTLIGAMESGATVYTSVEPSDVVAQDLGDAVVLTGIAAISVNSGGNPNSFRVRFTDVYANKSGEWQMVTWQSTKLA